MSSYIYAYFQDTDKTTIYTKTAYQYDRGVKLRLSGIPLPEKYQIHFSNSETEGVATARWVSGSELSIPDAYFETGDYIHVWIYTAQDGTYMTGSSDYHVIIPIEKRPAILRVNDTSGGLVINADLDESDHSLIFH